MAKARRCGNAACGGRKSGEARVSGLGEYSKEKWARECRVGKTGKGHTEEGLKAMLRRLIS